MEVGVAEQRDASEAACGSLPRSATGNWGSTRLGLDFGLPEEEEDKTNRGRGGEGRGGTHDRNGLELEHDAGGGAHQAWT